MDRFSIAALNELSRDPDDLAFENLLKAPVDVASGVTDSRIHGVIVGELIGVIDSGTTPLVRYPGQAGTVPISARSIADLDARHIGSEVVLMFEGGDPSRPIVVGRIRGPARGVAHAPSVPVEVVVDGKRVVVSAQEQLVLRCGRASITLTAGGKVLIQGDYVSSRASGVNRVRGGSVQIN